MVFELGVMQEFKLKDYATLFGLFVGFFDISIILYYHTYIMYFIATLFIFAAIIADFLMR